MYSVSSLRNWFDHALAAVFERHDLNFAAATRGYLSGLLEAFAGTPRLTERAPGRAAHRSLGEWYLQAALSPAPARRREALRTCGDLALFVCGVFPGYVSARVAGHDYYANMGRSAYAELSRELPTDRSTFDTLACAFGVIADALGETVWGEDRQAGPLAAYERWLASESPLARERLAAYGIAPVPAASPHVRH